MHQIGRGHVFLLSSCRTNRRWDAPAPDWPNKAEARCLQPPPLRLKVIYSPSSAQPTPDFMASDSLIKLLFVQRGPLVFVLFTPLRPRAVFYFINPPLSQRMQISLEKKEKENAQKSWVLRFFLFTWTRRHHRQTRRWVTDIFKMNMNQLVLL